MTWLAFGGGGARGFAHIGAYARLLEIPGFELTGASGASAGAIKAAVIAAGHHPAELLDFAVRLKPSEFMVFNWQFLWRPGLFKIRLQDVLEPWVPSTLGDYEIPLVVTATGSQSGEHLIYSTELTPGLPTIPCVQASARFPLVFVDEKVKGVRTWDGGLWNNFPVEEGSGDVIGIRLDGERPAIVPWRWYFGGLKNIIALLMDAIEREHIEDAAFSKIITLKTPVSPLDFHKLDADMIKRLYEIGYETVEKKLASGWSWR